LKNTGFEGGSDSRLARVHLYVLGRIVFRGVFVPHLQIGRLNVSLVSGH
jgi:hypothetical protein